MLCPCLNITICSQDLIWGLPFLHFRVCPDARHACLEAWDLPRSSDKCLAVGTAAEDQAPDQQLRGSFTRLALVVALMLGILGALSAARRRIIKGQKRRHAAAAKASAALFGLQVTAHPCTLIWLAFACSETLSLDHSWLSHASS